MKYLLSTLLSCCLFLVIGAALILELPHMLALGRGQIPPGPAPLQQSSNPGLALGAITAPLRPQQSYGEHRFGFAGKEQLWIGQGPQQRRSLRPAVILLADRPEDVLPQLASWEATARAQDLVLIAPVLRDLPGQTSETATAALMAEVLTQAKRLYAIDTTKIYLFGQGKGADLALALADNAVMPLRALALMAETPAGALNGSARPALRFYRGQTPGTSPTTQADAVAASYAKAGFPTEMVHVPSAKQLEFTPALAADAWHFLQGH